MVQVLIMCAGGMSSSLVAKKVTEHFAAAGKDIHVEARGVSKAPIEAGNHALYLISPQVRMYYQPFSELANQLGRKIAQIPPQAYVPIPMGTEKLAQLIEENLA